VGAEPLIALAWRPARTQTEGMEFAGVLPPDAPDPRSEAEARVAALAFPVWGLVAQDRLEDDRSPGIGSMTDSAGLAEIEISIGYTVWRNPRDRADPINLAELDPRMRAALDDVPPWPRPGWLVEEVERMRYPRLWEAVRTTWRREPSHDDLEGRLVHHANHILMNRFREELGLPQGPSAASEDTGWRTSRASVDSRVSVVVDGAELPAAQIDTDPFVYAIGTRPAEDLVLTAVIPREFLPSVTVEFRRRT